MNDDFISSSIETGMRIPGDDADPEGGTGGVGGGGEEPSIVSMRWPRNLSRTRGQVTACERMRGSACFSAAFENFVFDACALSRRREPRRRVFSMNNCVCDYSCDTDFREFSAAVRAVMVTLPWEPTFPSKTEPRAPKKP